MLPDQTIVKRGSWLYDGVIESALIIVQGDVLYGSGDYEDPPEVREDRHVVTFQVWFESPPGSGAFRAASREYTSLQEAIEDVAKLLPSPPKWE